MRQLSSAAITARLYDGTPQKQVHFGAFSLVAENQYEARGLAIEEGLRWFPIEEGYGAVCAKVLEVPLSLLQQVEGITIRGFGSIIIEGVNPIGDGG